MLVPVRCFSCGKPVGHLYEKYKERTGKGEEVNKVLDDFGLERYCCRRMLLTQVDIAEEIMQYEKF
ncbi:MAG TPA: DNA-directed RNA polymerase subunit N [archaeon]|nr:DNA-directed RNA polymerase subunit N [archaeon]HLD80483.1 DNA-directed RNA polymerase subunit N [archaeon]